MDWSSCFFPQTDSISRCASATWKCCLHRFGEVPTGQHKPKVHGKKLIKYISNCLKLSNPMSTKHPKHPKVHQLSMNCPSIVSVSHPFSAHGKLHLQPRWILRPRRRTPCRTRRGARPLGARGLGTVAHGLQAPPWDFWGFWRSKNISNPWVFKRKPIQKDNYNPMGS